MNLKTELLAHQRAASDKLSPLKVGALFMDMGTGKSRTIIDIVNRKGDKVKKVVWFCPVSLKDTVRYEIEKHIENPSVYVFDAKTQEDNIPAASWYVIGIESMSSSPRVLFSAEAIIDADTFVIVDESSYIKGHNASRTEWITKLGLKARYRFILTGTPVSQGIVDLYAQMRFLSEKILGFASFYSFANKHLEYSEKFPDMISRTKHQDLIAAKIAPYVYQVKKEECLTLPDKLYETHYCEMSYAQRDIYEATKHAILSELDDEETPDWISRMAIFRLFSALQQITCGFLNRRNPDTGCMEIIEVEHSRLDALEAVLSGIPEDEKVIVWAKFRHDVLAIAEKFPDSVTFYGGMSEKSRIQALDRFRLGKPRLFLATQDCGGHGLTVNEAAYAVFYNNQFKYSNRAQSECRNHRIGQTRKVTYIDIVCAQSIDVRIQRSLESKENVVEKFHSEVQKCRDARTRKEALLKL